MKKMSTRTGFLFLTLKAYTIDLTSLTVIKMGLSERKILPSTQKVLQLLWLIGYMKNIKHLMVSLIMKVSYSLYLQWKTRNLLKHFNIFGGFLMSTIKMQLTHSLLTCSSDQSSKNCRFLIEEDSMLKISRTRFSIWQNLSYLWR